MTEAALTTPLDHAGRLLRELDERCCDPGRSPSMAALAAKLNEVRVILPSVHTDASAAARALRTLEELGGMIGSLQIGCCAPNRLPLYAEMLAQLTGLQIAVHRSAPAATA